MQEPTPQPPNPEPAPAPGAPPAPHVPETPPDAPSVPSPVEVPKPKPAGVPESPPDVPKEESTKDVQKDAPNMPESAAEAQTESAKVNDFGRLPSMEDIRRLQNEKRRSKRLERLSKLESFIASRESVSNRDVRDFLRISQSTATNYLSELLRSGKIISEGRGRGKKYKKI